MEMTYRLSQVTQVELHEQVYSWVVRGLNEMKWAHEMKDFMKNREGAEENAKELTVEWCKEIGADTYVVQTFTRWSYWFLLTTIDVATGATLEAHEEYYGSEQA